MTEKSIVTEMCAVQLKDRKTYKDMMLMLCLNKQQISWLWKTVFIGMVMCRGERMAMS